MWRDEGRPATQGRHCDRQGPEAPDRTAQNTVGTATLRRAGAIAGDGTGLSLPMPYTRLCARKNAGAIESQPATQGSKATDKG